MFNPFAKSIRIGPMGVKYLNPIPVPELNFLVSNALPSFVVCPLSKKSMV